MTRPEPHPRVSAVVPAYNEVECLPSLLDELERELERSGVTFEILVVDDGSTDGSRELLDALADARPHLQVIHLDGNHGQSAALLAGFDGAQGDYILTLDADLQNDPTDVSRLLEWIPQYDMVAGIRRVRRDSWLRRAQSRIANRTRQRVLGDGIVDTGCSLKLFRRDLAAHMPRFNGMHRFLPFLAQLQGAGVAQVAVGHRPRLRGTSKYSVKNRLFRGLFDLIGTYWLKRRFLDYRVAYASPRPQAKGLEPKRTVSDS